MRPAVSPALFDQFARGWRGYLVIALIALASSLMGAAHVSVMDADEARFAQASRQMVESGDYVRIRLQDEERNRKPIGTYWAQAASTQLLAPITGANNEIWTYRLPSALGVALAALATLWGGAALVGQRAAFMGAALLAAGLLLSFEGMTAKADALLVGFTTLAVAALARLRMSAGAPRTLALLFWAALACGILIKGPVTPAVAALTLIALGFWERRADWMKPLLWWPGPVLAALIALPWLIAIGAATHGRFFNGMLVTDIGAKLIGQDQAHLALPGFYIALLPILIFPATYALPAAGRIAWEALRAPASEARLAAPRFLMAWAAPTLLVLELLPTKLVHYALPVYPAIALLCGAGLMGMRGKRWRISHPVGVAVFAVVGALIVAMMAFSATLMPGDFEADARRAISAGIVGAIALGIAVLALILLRRPVLRAGAIIACALVLSFSLRERLLPESRALFPSAELVDALARERLMPTDERQLWSVGYDEISLVFLTRTTTRLATETEAAAGAALGDTLIIEGRALERTKLELARRGLVFESAGDPVRGFSLGLGDRVALYFGRVSAVPADAPPQSP